MSQGAAASPDAVGLGGGKGIPPSPARILSIVYTACDTILIFSHGGVNFAIPLIRCEVRGGFSRGRPADAGAFCRIFYGSAQAQAPVTPSVFPRYRRCLPGNIRASV